MIFFFFFNDTATTEIYTLSLHDALPILAPSIPGGYPTGQSTQASEKAVRPASCYRVYGGPIRVLDSQGLKLTGRTEYGRAECRAADPGTAGHRRSRELERRGARGARQVLFAAYPGRRC